MAGPPRAIGRINPARFDRRIRIHKEVAERHEPEYAECRKWAHGIFGRGVLPSHRHYSVAEEE
jgi:hypothetical protein